MSWPRRAVRDEGTTLAELSVTMLITGIVVATTISLVIGFQRSNAENIARQDQIDTARTAVEAMSSTLRSAVKPAQLPTCNVSTCPDQSFLRASATSVRFYANLDNANNAVGPSRVTYEVITTGAQAGQLLETVQRPDSNVPGAGGYLYCDATLPMATEECKSRASTRPVAFGVLTTVGSSLFTYYDKNGDLLVPVAGGSLSSDDIDDLVSVEIHVVALSTGATKADPTEYIQRITLPNAQSLIRQTEEVTP